MRQKKWNLFIIGRFFALVLGLLLSHSANAYTECNSSFGSTTIQRYICLGYGNGIPNVKQVRKNASNLFCEATANYPQPSYNTICSQQSQYAYFPCAVGENRQCDNGTGQTYPACSSGTTRDSSNNCVSEPAPIIQDCPIGQYKNSSNVCVNQTKCHLENPNGVNPYFDVNTGTCKEPELPSLVCGSPNTVACEPLNDCIKTTSYCSNSIADKAAHDALQLPTTSQQKQIAQAAATAAAASASAAITIKNTVDADVVTKQNAYNSASTAYNNNPSPETLAPMATALNDYQSATSTSSKVGTSSASAGTASNNANSANNAIDPNNTKQGIAENKATEAEYWKNEAARALSAAGRGTTYIINNYPSPGITGDNESDNDSAVTDADNDGTPDGIDKNDVDNGQGPNFGETSGISQSNQALVDAFNQYPAIQGVNQIRQMNFGGSGSCPSLVLNTGETWFGSLSTNAHCEIISQHTTLIQNMSRIVWVIGALFLFFSA